MGYPKINSLWKREGWYFDQDKKQSPDYQKGRQSFIVGDYSCPEFSNIKTWNVTEKIDGTNIRIYYYWMPPCNMEIDRYPPRYYSSVSFHGRTDKAVIPKFLAEYLTKKITIETLESAFEPDILACTTFILYGEGYGPKIQAVGSKYRDDVGFILFDVRVGDFWLKRDAVKDIAVKLDIPVVPDLGIMNECEIVEYVKSKPMSLCSKTPQVMEGIVARSSPELYCRDGSQVMFKLKCKEFV